MTSTDSGPEPHPGGEVRQVEVAVIGAGQAGLATGYHLRRAGLTPGSDFQLIDAAQEPGGSWSRMWPGLRLFLATVVLLAARPDDAAVDRGWRRSG